MIKLLALLSIVACGSGPHDMVPCGSWPSLVGESNTCALACEQEPANYDRSGEDMPCEATDPTAKESQHLPCPRTFEYEGLRGCCRSNVPGDQPGTIRFYVCD